MPRKWNSNPRIFDIRHRDGVRSMSNVENSSFWGPFHASIPTFLPANGPPVHPSPVTVPSDAVSRRISRDPGQAQLVLAELRNNLWLDEATRMLFVDVNLYNPDHNVFVLANLYVEIPPTAGLLPR